MKWLCTVWTGVWLQLLNQNWGSGILKWLNNDTWNFHEFVPIVKNAKYSCYYEKYYKVGIICIFIININSWKFQVSLFNHFRIPLSQFWFSNWSHNPVYTVHNHDKNEAIYSVTWWNVIHASIRIETIKFLYDWTMILKFSWVHMSCENANY